MYISRLFSPRISKSWRIINLGKNPRNGGRPPRDNRREKVINWRVRGKGKLVKWLSWTQFILLNKINKGKSSTIYITKYISSE